MVTRKLPTLPSCNSDAGPVPTPVAVPFLNRA